MLENLQKKVEEVAEAYADLILLEISETGNVKEEQKGIMCSEKLLGNEKLNDINEGIRMLNHVANTLERIDRIQHGNTGCGHSD